MLAHTQARVRALIIIISIKNIVTRKITNYKGVRKII